MQDLLAPFAARLKERKEDDRLRCLKTVTPGASAAVFLNGRELVNFASNDYLGLSTHPSLKARAISFTQRWGVGSSASRLVCGNIDAYDTIEKKLAKLKGTEAALVFASGYQANSTVLGTLSGDGSLLALDRLSHNSLLSGAQLSRCRFLRFKHNDLADLEQQLSRPALHKYTSRWVVSESIFSMDGDSADIDALCRLSANSGSGLYLDEAHATGVFGRHGMGLTAGRKEVTVAMGTFGKGLGSFGAYIACSETLRDYLINFCPGLIYSTALPPAVLGAIDAALDIIPSMDRQREYLLDMAEGLRVRLKSCGFDTGNSCSQIIPILVGSDKLALELARHLEAAGIFAPAIRTPTVPANAARVRISLSAHHTKEQIDHLIKTLSNWHEN